MFYNKLSTIDSNSLIPPLSQTLFNGALMIIMIMTNQISPAPLFQYYFHGILFYLIFDKKSLKMSQKAKKGKPTKRPRVPPMSKTSETMS